MIYSNIYENGKMFNESEYDPFETVKEMECKNLLEGAYIGVYETECNYARLMESIGVSELTYYVETGKDIVTEAGYGESFFEKAKKFFKSIIDKIASLFKKFIALIDSYIKTDKEFVNKYKKALIKVNTRDFEYKGYKFTNLDYDINSAANKMDNVIDKIIKNVEYDNLQKVMKLTTQEIDELTKDINENRDKYENQIRNCAIDSGSNETEASELPKDLFEYFRDGEDSPTTIDTVNVNELFDTITNYKDAKKKATKTYNDLKKAINKDIKELERKEKEFLKGVPSKNKDSDETSFKVACAKHASYRVSLMRTKLNTLQVVNGAILAALKDENRQAKAVCVKLLTYKPKTEGYMYESEVNTNIFGDVNFR